MTAFVNFFLDRGLFINLITFIFIVVGAWLALNMNNEAFPNIDFDIVSVSTIYKGASPEEVEKLVSNPLEDTIKEVDGIKEFRSTSLENRSGIVITIDPDVKDTSKVIDDIRSAIERAEDIPKDADEPILTEITTARQPVIQWSLQRIKDNQGRYILDYRALRKLARRLEHELLLDDDVARITRQGWRNSEIFVDVDPDKLNQLYISTDSIIRALELRNVNFPGGELKTSTEDIAVRTLGEFRGVKEILATPLRSNEVGLATKLSALAHVYEDFAEPDILETTMGNDAINLTIVKRQSADIINVVNSSKRAVLNFNPYTIRVDITYPDLSDHASQKKLLSELLNHLNLDNKKELSFLDKVKSGFDEDHGILVDKIETLDHSRILTFIMDTDSIKDKDIDNANTIFKKRDQDLRKSIQEFFKNKKENIQIQFVSKPRIDGLKIIDLNDESFSVRRRLSVLASNGATGLLLVIVCLLFFMDWRTSLMVALGIPVTLGITFIVMNYMGITLNLMSMFALILVLGIIVDDAIIVSENFFRYREEGLDIFEAASRGAAEMMPPILATIATTIAAFGPMMFMSGIFGKFIYAIPLVVIIALLASLFECFVILPSHLKEIDGVGKKNTSRKNDEAGRQWFVKFRNDIFLPALSFILRHRLKSIVVLLLLFITSIGIWKQFVGFKLFPATVETLHVKFTAPSGTNKKRTSQFIKAFEYELKKLPKTELINFSSRAGIIKKPVGDDKFIKYGSNYGQTVVYLTLEQDRPDISSSDIVDKIRSRTEWLVNDPDLQAKQSHVIPPGFAHLKGQLEKLEIEMLAGGPPVGKAIAIEILGDDFDVLQQIASEYKTALSQITGITDIDDDYIEGKKEYQIKIDDAMASQAGVNSFQIAQAINTAFEGTEATSIRRIDEDVKIRVRFARQFRNNTQALSKLFVNNQQQQLIPVSPMISITKTKSVVSIGHLDARRLITVTANIDKNSGMSSVKATSLITKATRHIPSKYPGYTIQFGGENKDTEESMESLAKSFIVAFFIIFIILASLFKSLVQPFVVMVVIPFTLIGVIFSFWLHGLPLSFLSLLGVVGLAGIVINDSIVLVDVANQIRSKNPEWNSIQVVFEASKMRFRAVILTTLTTVMGLLPTAYGLGGSDPFLVPMALSFAWGLLFSTVLVLGLVPVLFSLVMDLQLKLAQVKFNMFLTK